MFAICDGFVQSLYWTSSDWWWIVYGGVCLEMVSRLSRHRCGWVGMPPHLCSWPPWSSLSIWPPAPVLPSGETPYLLYLPPPSLWCGLAVCDGLLWLTYALSSLMFSFLIWYTFFRLVTPLFLSYALLAECQTISQSHQYKHCHNSYMGSEWFKLFIHTLR